MSTINANTLANRLGSKSVLVDELITKTSRTLNPSSSNPVVRDDGTNIQVGDEYFNTADGYTYKYSGSVWTSSEKLVKEVDQKSKIMSSALINEGFVQTNSLTQPAVKVSNDPTGTWTIFQGFTWIPETEKLYTAWDVSVAGVSQVVIMRHDSNGNFELRSANIAANVLHGQDLGHAYYNGVLYLFSASPNGRGVTVFTPPTTAGGQIGNIRQFTLFPEGWVVAFPNESSDFKSIVANAWDNSRASNPYYTRIFNFKTLMDGLDGDRFNDYLTEVNISPKNDYWGSQNNTVQSVTCDSANVYVLTGTDVLSSPKYMSAFSITTGARIWRKEILVGKARASAKGSGTILEYEGMAWLPSNSGSNALWVGVRMQDTAGTRSEMYMMPVDERMYGSSGSSSAGFSALHVKNKQITYPKGQDVLVSEIDENGIPLTTLSLKGTGKNVDSVLKTHEHLIFKKKKILSLPLKNPEWDWLSSTKSVRFYPQTFCLDEYSGKVLIIDGTQPDKTVLVYDWPSGNFDRVFFCTGGLVSESAVVKMEGNVKYLYLRTTGDKLAKYDITTYPTARTSITAATVLTTPCGLNFMERNGNWTISDIASSALGNVRSRGKFIKTDANLNVIGSVDCGDYLMGIYAGRDGENDVTKTQGVTDTGYGIVAQMGGQWVYPNTVTNYSQNGLRVFNYDGELIAEGLLQPDKFRSMIADNWGFTPDVIEAEGITTANNGDVFSLNVTSNNGTSTVSSVHGMLIVQEFAHDGDDFTAAAASRLGTFKQRGSLTTTGAGSFLIDPTTNTNITTIQQLLVAMQKSGIPEWAMYTTGIPIVDTAGNSYPVGCLLTVTMFRSDIYYTHLKGVGVNIRKRIYYDTGTTSWIEGQAYDSDGTTTFSASGISVTRTSGGPTFTMNGPVGTLRQFFGQTSGLSRWRLSLGDSIAESGSDAGSNFALGSYTDAGVYKNTPLQVVRSSGETQLTQLASSGPIKTGLYTLTTLPSAALFQYYLILVTNATGGAKWCMSNGTVWQIINTTTTVS